MPLPSPILDDRRYEDLFGDLRRRITVYNPEWTDHNDSDPGITLLQLFAYMTESVLFRLNQVPEATQHMFLRLLDVKLRPATPARTILGFKTDRREGALIPQGAMAYAGDVPFRAVAECMAWPVEALAVARVSTRPPASSEDAVLGGSDDPELFDVMQARLTELAARKLPVAETMAWYKPDILRQGQSGRLAFDTTIDRTLWIALLNDKAGQNPIFSGKDAYLNLAIQLAEAPAAMTVAAPCPDDGSRGNGGALVVEIGRPGLGPDGLSPKITYERLSITRDGTNGLTQSGVLGLMLPRIAETLDGLPVDEVQAGTGNWPPPLPPDDNERLWLWLKVVRQDSLPPPISLIAANAVEASQIVRADPEILGAGDGQPGQIFSVAHGPMIAGDPALPVLVEVEEMGVWTRWKEIADLALANDDDRFFSLDPESGTINFGGRGPDIGERVRVLEYSYGGGLEGNIPAGAIDRVDGAPPGTTVTNLFAGRGGAASEDLQTALTRLPGELRRRDRAVTASDFRELALFTPGAGVSRAECLPRFHPRLRAWDQPGIVSVMIWPESLPADGSPPVPDRASIGLVCAQLSARRLVTTELYVLPPEYVEIAISVKVAVEDGFGIVAVTRWAETILRQFLSPLPPHGPAGEGWPLGRAVNPRELEATVLQVQGVDFIEGIAVARGSDSGWIKQELIRIDRHQIVWLKDIVVVGPGVAMPEPGQSAAGPESKDPPMPIAVIREVC